MLQILVSGVLNVITAFTVMNDLSIFMYLLNFFVFRSYRF